MSNRQIDVQIMGQSYILGCPEGGEERLMGAVRKVDEAMCKIRDAGKIKARDRIAVLAALNLAFEQSEANAARTAMRSRALIFPASRILHMASSTLRTAPIRRSSPPSGQPRM